MMAIQTSTEAMGEPEDIAAMVLYLASDDAKFINGAAMVVDNAITVS